MVYGRPMWAIARPGTQLLYGSQFLVSDGTEASTGANSRRGSCSIGMDKGQILSRSQVRRDQDDQITSRDMVRETRQSRSAAAWVSTSVSQCVAGLEIALEKLINILEIP